MHHANLKFHHTHEEEKGMIIYASSFLAFHLCFLLYYYLPRTLPVNGHFNQRVSAPGSDRSNSPKLPVVLDAFPHNKGPRKSRSSQSSTQVHTLSADFIQETDRPCRSKFFWLLNIDLCTHFFIYSSICLSIYMYTWICGLRLKVILTVVLMHQYLYWAVKIEIEWHSWHCLPIHKIQGAKLKRQHCDSEYWQSILRTCRNWQSWSRWFVPHNPS